MASSWFQEQSWSRSVGGYFACVTMAGGWSEGLTRRLDRELAHIHLGRVAGADPDGIALSLASDGPAALAEVARILARLNAPAGTWVGHAECPRIIEVARLNAAHCVISDRVLRGGPFAGGTSEVAYAGAEARLLAALERAAGRLH